MEDEEFANVLEHISQKFTPEYFEEISRKNYEEDRQYPENFSNWYPHIKDFGELSHVGIISNQILTLEETKVLEQENKDKVDWDKLNEILKPTLDKMEPYRIYNLKNGCFSNKFDFQTSLVTKQDIAEKLWKINYKSAMYDTGGYTEIVVRDLIPNTVEDKHPKIYNGMPLRNEYRAFYNMTTKQVEYVVDYWNYEYCRDKLNTTDGIVFDYFHSKLKYEDNKDIQQNIELYRELYKDVVKQKVETLEFDTKLKGIWSIDVLLEDDTYYLIDMARGFRSAYWDVEKLTEETKQEVYKEIEKGK